MNVQEKNHASVASTKTEDELEKEIEQKTGLSSIIKLAKCEYLICFILSLIFGFIAFVYSVMRIVKDKFVIEKQLPAAISPIKFGLVLPVSIFFVGLTQKGLHKYGVSKIFDIILIGFCVIFVLIAFVLLPYDRLLEIGEFWTIDRFADKKMAYKGFHGFLPVFSIYNEWVYTFIYLIAELFGSLGMQFIFMAFINEALTPRQNRRFIPLLYMVSNIFLMLSGFMNSTVSDFLKNRPYSYIKTTYSSYYILFAVLMAVSLGMKHYVEKSLLSTPMFIRTDTATSKKSKKPSIGFIDGIKIMIQSKLVIAASCNAMFYALCTNFIESSFKSGLGCARSAAIQEGKTFDIQKILAYEQYIVGALVVIVLLSPTSRLIMTKGWIYLGIVTPMFTLLSSSIILGMAFLNYPNTNQYDESNILFSSIEWLKVSPDNKYINIYNEAYFGMLFCSLMKVGKYAFFDIAKEALLIHLDPAYRAKFKAVIDGLCNKFGKSSGAFYVFVVNSLIGSNDIRKMALFTLILILIVVFIWIKMVFYLDKQFTKATVNQTYIDIDLFSGKKEFD